MRLSCPRPKSAAGRSSVADVQSDSGRMIAGLSYQGDFISADEHDQTLAAVDEAAWSTALKRRVQHYGYRYDYKARAVDRGMYLGPLPAWAQWIMDRMLERHLLPEPPDQLIVNEYQPGQGITPHIDCVPCFGPAIASLSLGSTCLMEFSQPKTQESTSLLLWPRSLLVLKDDARYHWRHSIRARRSDTWQGVTYPRSRRVSLTFRTVRLTGR